MPGKPFQSKYAPHLSDILKWREEGKTFAQIATLLPSSLKPTSRVISDLVSRRNKGKSYDHDLVTIPITITIPKENLQSILEIFAKILSEKMPTELRQQIQQVSVKMEPPQTNSFNYEEAKANSEKALALAARIKAEQAEKARQAALTPPRPKLNKDRIDLPPDPSDRPRNHE